MFRLDDQHLEAAQQIALKHRRRKSCDNCYERGWIGVTDSNLLVLCTHCVDMEAAMAEWKEYVANHEDLKEHFSELFEEKESEQAETPEQSHPKQFEHKKNNPHAAQQFIPGQRRPGHAKKIG